MTLEIRLATVADLPAVVALYNTSGLESGAPVTLSAAQVWFETIQTYPNYTLWIAQENDAIVGTFALLIVDNLVHHSAPSGLIEGVAVDPNRQGQGIGRQMMNGAIAQCRAAGCYKLTLSTNLNRTAAHAFYESLGFEKHGYSYRVDL